MPTANVIFLYMDADDSQVDTFDYKPNLEKYHGRDPHSVFKSWSRSSITSVK